MKKYGEMDVNKYKEMNDSRLTKGLRVLKREGAGIFFKRFYYYCERRVLSMLAPLIMASIPKRFFKYKEKEIPYFKHKKSLTWTNERAVEIPVAMDYINSSEGKRILEVGAVLPHYFPNTKKDTLDKFEKGNGIINEDVITYNPTEKYDLIVSISTLEHVGFDDDEKDPEGILKAMSNLRNNCLNENGKLVVTLPIGYNKWVDDLLFSRKLGFSDVYAYKRSKRNIWKEVPLEDVRDCKYEKQSEAIVIGVN